MCRSVAFGQRAPNRASAREEGRGLGAGLKGASGQGRFDQECVHLSLSLVRVLLQRHQCFISSA